MLEGQFIVNETDEATVNNNESCAHILGHTNTPNTNLRCSSCSPGFVPVKETGQCRKCGKSGEATALIIVAALAGIIIFVVMIALAGNCVEVALSPYFICERTNKLPIYL